MTDPRIPTEEDMMSEALENNRRNGIAIKHPTKGTPWAWDRAWVDDQKIAIRLMDLSCQLDEWCEENDKYLAIIYNKGPKFHDLWEELEIDAVGEARENLRSLRYL